MLCFCLQLEVRIIDTVVFEYLVFCNISLQVRCPDQIDYTCAHLGDNHTSAIRVGCVNVASLML